MDDDLTRPLGMGQRPRRQTFGIFHSDRSHDGDHPLGGIGLWVIVGNGPSSEPREVTKIDVQLPAPTKTAEPHSELASPEFGRNWKQDTC